MDNDVVEQAHEIYFNVIVAHGDADDPWSPEQRAELVKNPALIPNAI